MEDFTGKCKTLKDTLQTKTTKLREKFMVICQANIRAKKSNPTKQK